MLRVDYEDLEPSDDFLLLHYSGEPFTGIAFENNEHGDLMTETSFIEGQKSGCSREWSASGVLIREQWFALNALHGDSKEWYADGSLKAEGSYELGVCLKEQEWDANGNRTRDYSIDKDGPQFATLEKLRKSNIGLMVNGPQGG